MEITKMLIYYVGILFVFNILTLKKIKTGDNN
jgi:hypothetical protein